MAEKFSTALNGLTTSQQMVSSCTGAFITAIFMTPFDVVKVRLQTQQREMLSSRCFLYCNGLMDHICTCAPAIRTNNGYNGPWYSKPLPVKLNGTIDAFIKISRNEGLKSLWSGLPPTLIVAIPNTIVYLTCYETILKSIRLRYYPQDQPSWAGGFAGGLARCWSVSLFSPLELLRTKMQSKSISYREVFSVLLSEYKTSGVSSLWRGLSATLLRDVPFSVIYWMTYENLKQKYHQRHPTVSFSLLAGGTAGGFAGMITLPLDVVKTHQQIELDSRNGNKTRTTVSMLSHIYRQQGIAGLFTGLVPRLAKVVPACAVMIASYEFAKAFFRQRNELKRISRLQNKDYVKLE